MTIIDEQGREIETRTGEIVAYKPEPFRILDPYAEEGTVAAGQRPDWLGVISAGYKNKDGYPEMSKDGTIHVAPQDRERAKNLIAALAANGNKKLTIAFPYDDLDSIIIQRFTRRSASALEVYGDQHRLTEIKLVRYEPEVYRDGRPKVDKQTGQPIERPIHEHITHMAGTPEYKALLRTCKAEVHVLFALAEWEGMRPVVKFPDGVGWYALRFTSRNSLQAIAGKLQEISSKLTQGRIAGIPFELSISYREVAAPDGAKRKVAVWRLDFEPPKMVRLVDSGNLQQLLSGALDEGRRLRGLPAPEYGIEQAISEEADVELEMPVEQAVEVLTNGDPPADPPAWEARWFTAVRGTHLGNDEARAEFIAHYTGGQCDSLSKYLAGARESEASALIEAAKAEVAEETAAKRQAALEAEGFTAAKPDAGAVIEGESREVTADDDAIPFDGRPDGAAIETAPDSVVAEAAPKSKQRLTNERNYAQLMTAASKLDIDLAAFETGADTSDAVLTSKLGALAAAIRTRTEGVAAGV